MRPVTVVPSHNDNTDQSMTQIKIIDYRQRCIFVDIALFVSLEYLSLLLSNYVTFFPTMQKVTSYCAL